MMEQKIKIKQTIVVEGRYDKAKLSSFLDANIIETGGFRIYRDEGKRKLLKKLAEQDGLIIVTDSDSAGFRIRNYLRSCVGEEHMTQVFLPDIFGKERRKAQPSAEGKLGVEGMHKNIILQAFSRAGIPLDGQTINLDHKENITKSDFIEMGLSGGTNSGQLRENLLKYLDLPERISPNSLLKVLNKMITKEELYAILAQISTSEEEDSGQGGNKVE